MSSSGNIYFYFTRIPPLLSNAFSRFKNQKMGKTLVDLGCGDGSHLYALYHNHLLDNTWDVLALDISEKKCDVVRRNLPNVKVICADALLTPFKNSQFDFVLCTTVIEHTNDESLLSEINRIMKKGGLLYITTVIKKPHGFFIYRKNGKFVIDPTHLKEYSSNEEFLRLVENHGFEVLKYDSTNIAYSPLDFLLRLFVRAKIMDENNARYVYVRHSILEQLRDFTRLPIPGYFRIELLARKS